VGYYFRQFLRAYLVCSHIHTFDFGKNPETNSWTVNLL
jgi:hypothetical protein